tara:strand:+ start:8121 stop:9002 length:882 start_codon:yes stop_codon:yes gene_type:complete
MEPLNILVERLKEMATGFVELLPQIIFALVFVALTALVAKLAGMAYQKAMSRTRLRRALVVALSKVLKIIIWILGLLIAATIMFPDLTPGNLLAGLGIGSIAIGFAFKDIFENFIAGIFILLREPMRIGDYMTCEGVEGFVEQITLRDTYIRQSDGQLVVAPNAMLFTNPVVVVTDKNIRRVTVICGVAYHENIDESREVITEAVKSVDSVDTSKAPQIFAQEFADSSINFEVTWWTGSQPVDIRKSRDEVVTAVKSALDEAGIEIPFPYRTLTFKDPLSIAKEPSGDNDDQG